MCEHFDKMQKSSSTYLCTHFLVFFLMCAKINQVSYRVGKFGALNSVLIVFQGFTLNLSSIHKIKIKLKKLVNNQKRS